MHLRLLILSMIVHSVHNNPQSLRFTADNCDAKLSCKALERDSRGTSTFCPVLKPTYSSWLDLFIIPSLCDYICHQLAPPQASWVGIQHQSTVHAMTMLFSKSWIVHLDLTPRSSECSYSHTHTLSVMGRKKWPSIYTDNLHLGCSYHLHTSHHFLYT